MKHTLIFGICLLVAQGLFGQKLDTTDTRNPDPLLPTEPIYIFNDDNVPVDRSVRLMLGDPAGVTERPSLRLSTLCPPASASGIMHVIPTFGQSSLRFTNTELPFNDGIRIDLDDGTNDPNPGIRMTAGGKLYVSSGEDRILRFSGEGTAPENGMKIALVDESNPISGPEIQLLPSLLPDFQNGVVRILESSHGLNIGTVDLGLLPLGVCVTSWGETYLENSGIYLGEGRMHVIPSLGGPHLSFESQSSIGEDGLTLNFVCPDDPFEENPMIIFHRTFLDDQKDIRLAPEGNSSIRFHNVTTPSFQGMAMEYHDPAELTGPGTTIRVVARNLPVHQGGLIHFSPTAAQDYLQIENNGTETGDGIRLQVVDGTGISAGAPCLELGGDDDPQVVNIHPRNDRSPLSISDPGLIGMEGILLELRQSPLLLEPGPGLFFADIDCSDPGADCVEGVCDKGVCINASPGRPGVIFHNPTGGSVELSLMNSFTSADILPVICTSVGPALRFEQPNPSDPAGSGRVLIRTGIHDGLAIQPAGLLVLGNDGPSGQDGVTMSLSHHTSPLLVSSLRHTVLPEHSLRFEGSPLLVFDPGQGLSAELQFDQPNRLIFEAYKDGADHITRVIDPSAHTMSCSDVSSVSHANGSLSCTSEMSGSKCTQSYADGSAIMECDYEPSTRTMSCTNSDTRRHTSSGGMQCATFHNDGPTSRSVTEVVVDETTLESMATVFTPGEHKIQHNNTGLRLFTHPSQLTCEYDSRGLLFGQVVSEQYGDNLTGSSVRLLYDPNANLILGSGFAAPSVVLNDGLGGPAHLLVSGDLHVDGQLSKLAGTFRIDHPQDPDNKYLQHSFVESPDMMNIYNGNVVTGADGYATVELPGYFESLNIEFRYQLTVIGKFAQAIVKEKISNQKFVIQTDQPGVEVSWQVTGIRNDTYARDNRVQVEVDKADQRGTRLYTPDAK